MKTKDTEIIQTYEKSWVQVTQMSAIAKAVWHKMWRDQDRSDN